MEDKEKYMDFIDQVCEILGLDRPIDIIHLCKAVDEYLEPFEAHIRAAECRLAEYEKEVKELKKKIEQCEICKNHANPAEIFPHNPCDNRDGFCFREFLNQGNKKYD